MTQEILVTGATGYIAKHLIVQLLQKGYAVRGSVRSLGREAGLRADMIGAGLEADVVADRLSLVALDLTSDDGWPEAMAGVDAVMHTASPFPLAAPKDAQDLIGPAVEGTLRAMRAAHAAGVGRVILTSSVVAITSPVEKPGGAPFDETDWADVDAVAAYPQSKALAERAAWDFVQGEAPQIALSTINPGLVIGPPIGADYGTSLSLIERLLAGKDPMLPDLGFGIVDVRDVAALHIAALEQPEAAGERFAAVGGYMQFIEIADVLRAAHPDRKIAKRLAPGLMIRLLGLFDPAIRQILPVLGKNQEVSGAKSRDMLGFQYRDIQASLRETSAFLVG